MLLDVIPEGIYNSETRRSGVGDRHKKYRKQKQKIKIKIMGISRNSDTKNLVNH